MSALNTPRPGPAAARAKASSRTPRRKRPPRASTVDLADLLERAVETSRSRATENDVRIACDVLDALPVEACEHTALATLDTMLASAIANAVWGSRIECVAGPVRDRVVVRIRFLKPGRDQSPWSVDDGEVCAAWAAVSAATQS